MGSSVGTLRASAKIATLALGTPPTVAVACAAQEELIGFTRTNATLAVVRTRRMWRRWRQRQRHQLLQQQRLQAARALGGQTSSVGTLRASAKIATLALG